MSDSFSSFQATILCRVSVRIGARRLRNQGVLDRLTYVGLAEPWRISLKKRFPRVFFPFFLKINLIIIYIYLYIFLISHYYIIFKFNFKLNLIILIFFFFKK